MTTGRTGQTGQHGGRSKALLWTGVGLCAAGVVGLVVGAVLDVDAADPWASVAGGVAALIGIALTLLAQLGNSAPPPAPPAPGTGVNASGPGAIAAGGHIGTASTGGATSPPAAPSPIPAPSPAPDPATGGVNASGAGSIAAGGDIGTASTGN
ncbi:hypothetical protein [Streptomyces ipomoeae]|uniref:hypothetical protein n=1 Tax=Streptomyces ipomoeae TaxID=103232 RepID=UPI001F319802|nr:hypothetical protein [Streptomyces ipomoeae]MDX2695709.1 hypothetical protein [Streptomyces ipomoeae]MDX2841051.1 hypothetical protein [Streptomyces ipomoeae]